MSMVSRADQERRRARVRAMHHDEGLSLQHIADQLGVGKSTVWRDLRAEKPGPPASVPPPAADGNTRALKSGAYSESVLAPVRQRYFADLTVNYPHMPEGSRVSQAQRLAQLEVGANWIDEHGLMRPDGKPFDIGDKLMIWGQASERWYAEAAKLAVELARRSAQALSPVLAMQQQGQTGRDAGAADGAER